METQIIEQEITMPVIEAEESDVLAPFRARVAAEKELKPSVMSDKAAERLKQINYEDKIAKQSEEKFAYALTQIFPTHENLAKLIARCSGDPKNSRRLVKLLFWIQSRGWRLGHEIRLSSDIAFLSELTPDEVDMPDSVFAEKWRVKKIVAPISDEPEVRLCTLGRRCLGAVKGKAAPVTGKAEYCSVTCRGRAKILARKASTGQMAA
jgi:hypothetical protein